MSSSFPDRPIPLAFVGVPLTVVALCAGCAGPNPALQQARQAYAQAAGDPQVASNAPVALHEAGQTLQKAERAGGREEVNHFAYLAERQVAIARAEAERKIAETQAEQQLKQHDKILLEARTRKAQQLERELAELKAKKTERGYVLTLGDVLFDYNRATLKAGAQQNLYRLITFLKENPERTVTIEGYTDSTGSEEYNLDLSQRRAQSVQDFLLQNGISTDRITARGYGEASPVATNSTEAGRLQNRRVEIVISEQGRPVGST
jgi:OOP family OmpA-OmpF porin